MSETMTIPEVAYFGPDMDLSGLCLAAWPSAEKMSWSLIDAGIDYSITSCKRLRAGRGEPKYSLGCAIARIAERTIELDLNQRRARLAQLKRRRHG